MLDPHGTRYKLAGACLAAPTCHELQAQRQPSCSPFSAPPPHREALSSLSGSLRPSIRGPPAPLHKFPHQESKR